MGTLMKRFNLIIIFTGILLGGNSLAAIHYVGQSAQCNGVNHHDTLALALLVASLNGSESDEIRLTNTVTYQGNGDGAHVLANWNASSLGVLEIVGGYGDCGSSNNSGITVLGGGSEAVFRINGQSEVTLRNLSISDSESRGIIAEGEAVVLLESVDVSKNQAGIRVLGGAFVSIDDDSVVSEHGTLDTRVPKGGGIWCFGDNSYVSLTGRVLINRADDGGNIHISDGCFLDVSGGAEIRGNGVATAVNGGGVMVDNGGVMLISGDSSRVKITDHFASDNGGGVYVNGTGRAVIFNAFIGRNSSFGNGNALYASNGGATENQVVIDRRENCDFLISCSEIDNNSDGYSVIYVNNSKVKISRTLIEHNDYFQSDDEIRGMITATNGAYVQLAYSSITNNEARYLIHNEGSRFEMTHVTSTDNTYISDSGSGINKPYAWGNELNSSTLRIENSIFQGTQGADDRTTSGVFAKCNLVENSTDWPETSGAYVVGLADFNNVAGGDARQQSSSLGVDMCQRDTFGWSTERDIEYQVLAVNDATNPQGEPGEVDGMYDAGFDEVYTNIGDDEFLLTVQKEGSGEGLLLSDPLGISCGTDCTEVVFNSTLVKLIATPFTGSEFIRWRNCPLPDDNECFITVTENATVRAEFQPDDLIFSDDFE